MSSVIKNQAKLLGIALAAGLAWAAYGTGTALAASPEEECEADGVSVYTKAGPDSTCTTPGTPVGKSHNTKGGSQETGPGKSDTSTHEEEKNCTGVNNKPHPCP